MKKRKLVTLLVAVLVVVFAVVWVVNLPKNVSDSRQTAGSLHIKEWGVELPLSSAIADAYYTYDTSSDEIFISTKRLDSLLRGIHGCNSGLHGLYYKKTASPLSLVEQRRAEPLCAVPANSETEQIGTIQSDIQIAARAASTNY